MFIHTFLLTKFLFVVEVTRGQKNVLVVQNGLMWATNRQCALLSHNKEKYLVCRTGKIARKQTLTTGKLLFENKHCNWVKTNSWRGSLFLFLKFWVTFQF